MVREKIKKLLQEKREEISFLILITFLPTFVFARLYVYLSMKYNWENAFLVIRGVHIHHLSYGIILLALVGYCVLAYPHYRRFFAVLYGVALGLAFDEFGMWLRLEDNYWTRQSYDAVIAITALLFNLIFLKKFWKKVGKILSQALFLNLIRNNLKKILEEYCHKSFKKF
jgi:hypothetical protein